DRGLRALDDASLPDTAAGPGAWTFRVPGEGGVAGSVWRVQPGAPGDSAGLPTRKPRGTGSGTRETAGGAARPGAFRLLPVGARVREGRGARPARGFLLLSAAAGADRGS
ncbi:MAG: hypothetical protein ABEJ46_03185, partial [Gemmatimonadota bacterium]